MNSWLTYPEFLALCPDVGLSEETFSAWEPLAALRIQSATHWRAGSAEEPEQLDLLALCQAQLIRLTAGYQDTAGASLSGLTGVNNHGYSESYASAQQMQATLEQQQRQIISQTLSAPATRWMLYNGGSYRPPRCR